MKNALLIGIIAAAVPGCAHGAYAAQADGMPSGRWHGVMLRDGLRAPLAIELAPASNGWGGSYVAGERSIPLESVRMSRTHVHFELPGEAVFDGSIAGDEMAGSVSSGFAEAGSFALTREGSEPIGDSGP